MWRLGVLVGCVQRWRRRDFLPMIMLQKAIKQSIPRMSSVLVCAVDKVNLVLCHRTRGRAFGGSDHVWTYWRVAA